MHYHDSVYGQVSIDEPILVELINTKAVTRLNHILQHGITGFLGITKPVTRFQHSVGTMLLVRHFNAPLKEQIAALLHDVSHTAFSHVTDHVFSTPTGESYHEIMKRDYLQRSDIPGTLARFGFDWLDFLDDSQYPILEQPAPALCADRVDYFFRDSLALGILTNQQASYILSHLTISDKQIVVDQVEAAQLLALTYMEADEKSWSSLQAIGLYELMANTIRRAVQVQAITEPDVWQTDTELWNKLNTSQDYDLQRQLAQLLTTVEFEENSDDSIFEVTPKIRTIDPLVASDSRLTPLSVLDADYKKAMHEYLLRKQRRLCIRLKAK